MDRQRLLTIAVIGLLLLNLATLAFLFFHRPPHHPLMDRGTMRGEVPGRRDGMPMDRMLGQRLNLTEQQRTNLDTLRRQHRDQMESIDSQNRALVSRYFSLLRPGSNATSRDSIERTLGTLQQQKARLTFDHFAKLRAALTPQQQSTFDSLSPRLGDMLAMGHGPRPNGPRPDDRGPDDPMPPPPGDRDDHPRR